MRVLVVDDKPNEIELLRGALETAGPLELTSIIDGIEAMNLLSTMDPRRFDLILLDWRLPGMEGDQVAKIFLERADRERRIPVVFLSNGMPPEVRSDVGKSGCIVMEKPIDLDGYDELAQRLTALGAQGMSS